MADITITQGTVSHALSATTPDDPAAEIQPQHWNSGHAASMVLAASVASALFSNVNGVSFGLSGSAITASHNALTTAMASNRGSDFVQATAAFAGTSASGTIASNGISVSIGPYITTGMLSNAATISNIRLSAGTTSNLASAFTFADSNGISFGLNAGTITGTVKTDYQSAGAYLTTAALSNHSHGNPTLALTNLTGTTASASNGFTLSLSGNAAGGGDAIRGIAANGSTASTNTVNFSNANGVSFGFGAAGNSTVITASHNALTTARASNDAVGLNTALTANGVAWTVNSSGLSLNVPAFLTTAAQSNHSHGNPTLALTNLSGTTASASNGLTLSLSAAAAGAALINFSAGTTSSNIGSVVFSNANGVTFGLDASTITASVAAAGGGATLSYYENMWPGVLNNSATMVVSTSSMYVQPFVMPQAISVGYLRFPVSFSLVTTTRATSTGSYTFTAMQSNTLRVGIYTQGGGANSLSFSTIGTTTASWALQFSVSGSASSHSVSYRYTYPMSSGTASTLVTSQGTSSAVTVKPAQTSQWVSYRYLDVAWPTSFSAGNYWLGIMRASTTGGANIGVNNSFLAVTQHNSSIASINAESNSSIGFMLGLGSVSTNNTTAIPAAFGVSNVSTVVSNLRGPYFQMIRQA